MARANPQPNASRTRRLISRRLGVALFLIPAAGVALLAGAKTTKPTGASASSLHLPWREAGWSEREAAAILLDRLTYGPRPGDIDRVLAQGLENWLAEQVRADLPDKEVDAGLAGFHSVKLSARQLTETYPNPPQLLREAEKAGVIDRAATERLRAARQQAEGQEMSADGRNSGRSDRRELRETRDKIMKWASAQGYRDQREAIEELMAEKLLRATRSENQLREVLTDFFFNHFNVSLTDNESRILVPAYEREAIRPNVFGTFRQLLGATAQHPAMLLYLDNARSVAEEGQPTRFNREQMAARRGGGRGGGGRGGGSFAAGGRGGMGRGEASAGFSGSNRQARGGRGQDPAMAGLSEEEQRIRRENRPKGLNENYARELMELHTLGVDGGYDQNDVIEVARAFTGWTVIPSGPRRGEVDRLLQQASRFPQAGFVVDGAFLFRADVHDSAAKSVLGQKLPAGRGMEDGREVLDLLAQHPATARHLATKLAARFVADTPSEPLVSKLTRIYNATGGDLRRMVVAIVESPEFWAKENREQKIKSPFELAASALRALDAKVEDPRALFTWIERMGQPLYACQAPTGYPDRADAWVNTGSLLNRMNFGLQLATGRIGGVRLDLPSLNGHREPESLESALRTYVPILLPERQTDAAIARLEPMVRDPELQRKIEDKKPADGMQLAGLGAMDDWDVASAGGDRRRRPTRPMPQAHIDRGPLAQVVGVILGSPEFQRR